MVTGTEQRMGSRRWLAGAVVALVVSAGCSAADSTLSGGAPTATAGSRPGALPTVSAPEATALLASLPNQPRPSGSGGYVRAAFGTAWRDVDGNGCNQRDDVLLRDAVPGTARVQRQGRCDHDVLAGTWVDPYTGARMSFTDLKDLRQAQAIQIDHVVPLAEAWVSGASAWTAKRRLRYANELGDLVASSGPVNASKGADDPAAWRPKEAYQCAYATRWVAIKHRWRLAADPSEVAALEDMLARCGG